MSQHSYLDRAVNRNGDYLPGQKAYQIGGPINGTPQSAGREYFRPGTSQGLSEYEKTRDMNGGSEDLFLNLANDTLAKERPGRNDEARVSGIQSTA